MAPHLGEKSKGWSGTIVSVGQSLPAGLSQSEATQLTQRLMEMGFLPGAPVSVLHEGPVGRDPVAVQVRGTLLALRRQEANLVEVRDAQHD